MTEELTAVETEEARQKALKAKWNAAYKERKAYREARAKLDTTPTPTPKRQEPEMDNQQATTIKATNTNPALDPAMALVRCKIYNLDPKKANLPGEIISVANSQVGTVRKFIPFGDKTENGYHIPRIIFDFLKERKFLSITTQKGPGKGDILSVKQQWIPEFSLEVLPPLTKEELEELAASQRASAE